MKRGLLILGLLSLTLLLISPPLVHAGGVVGTGTPESCTEAALDAALAGGGTVTFNCGPSPVTITVTSTKTVAINTTVDGGGKITISGGGTVEIFMVNRGVILNVHALVLRHGYVEG